GQARKAQGQSFTFNREKLERDKTPNKIAAQYKILPNASFQKSHKSVF
ncbi:MAG: hypothetical protein QG567_1955, partial [Campylobacterota bacterium]|nr:hypothetical protein [Campylobacterota bacterium]